MAYPQKVKEYARELFLTANSEGDHQYSKTDIAKEIPKKFRKLEKNPDESTIRSWINAKDKITKKSWLDQWKGGQRTGYKEAVKEIEKKLDAEEKIELHIDSVMRDRANRAIKLCKQPDQKLDNGQTLDNMELKQIQLSEVIFNNLNIEHEEEERTDGLKEFANVLQKSREAAKKKGDN